MPDDLAQTSSRIEQLRQVESDLNAMAEAADVLMQLSYDRP